MLWQKILFAVLICVCLSPIGSPPLALALGLALAVTVVNPFAESASKITPYLLRGSVVLLGFGMNLSAVVKAGKDGVLFTIATIFGTLALGWILGKALKINGKTSNLISGGTAICGGSAIAAIAPAIRADADETSVSLGTIFILNSVALFVFPIIGHALNLNEHQFGIWSAIAIHDTSSVVGAGARYGAEALQVATTVKLARALWIAPVAFLFAFLYCPKNGETKLREMIPWLIFLFIGATIIRTYTPPQVPPSLFEGIVNLAKAGLTVTLFLIGASLSRETLKNVGIRPMLQGIILWLVISVVSLFAVWEIL
ncbi:MAG TPA: putative sulfate exporter family transporter [Pyrinomonadaceae bacterium]|nr:putative sulfate exporter family transporter [Pyrinomonadaceae bacterium]